MSRYSQGVARRILDLAGLLVPADQRGEWRRQWEGDLAHTSSGGGQPVRFALGAFSHAYSLRWRRGAPRGLLGEIRYSLRTLRRRPAFVLLTTLTLALGIGAATAVFSLAEATLFRSGPFEDAHQLVRIFSSNPSEGMKQFNVSFPDFTDFAGRDDLFQDASLFTVTDRDLSGEEIPERIRAAAVYGDFFQTLRVDALVGRAFLESDHEPASEPTVVLTEGLWRRRFGASDVVGRVIRLDGVGHTVIGVVPDRTTWPQDAQVWLPLQWGGTPPAFADRRSNHSWGVFARLQPGIDAVTADVQIREMARRIYADPEDERDEGTEALVLPLWRVEAGEESEGIFSVTGAAVFLVLLIACMNASGILLSHATSRLRELSIRSALGADRARLVFLLLAETGVLALFGGAVGLAGAVLGLRQLLRLAPADVPTLLDVDLNAPVVVAALGISLVSALVAGLVPAIHASRGSMTGGLKEGSHQSTSGVGGRRFRKGLVVAELALSMMLLVAAGLTVRGFQRQLSSDPGFDSSGLLTFSVRLPASRYSETAQVDQFYGQARQRLEVIPQIRSATTTSLLPLGAGGFSLYRAFLIEGQPEPPDGVLYTASWVEVDQEFFSTLELLPREGRALSAEDRSDAPPVIVVNETLADRMSREQPILGRQIRSFYDENLPRTVVGVVPDIQFDGITGRDEPAVFVPRSQSPSRTTAFMLRTTGDPMGMVPEVRQAMSELDRDVALDRIRTLRDAHRADLSAVRFISTLFGGFGVLALVLSLSGVYGLVSQQVSRRTQEIGVRMALGATTGRVRADVVAETGVLAGMGVVLGLGLSLASSRVLSAVLFDLPAMDVASFAGPALLLGLAALGAAWMPARKATAVDPVEALRLE